jgi:folate-binding protein YgfZ
MDELQALHDDVALVDVGALELIHAAGADRIAFLHRLLTGDVAGVPVGGGVRSLLLDLKAHVVSDMRVFVLPEEVRLVVAAGQGEPTAAALARYAIMDDFTATPDPAVGVLALHGPRAIDRALAAGVPAPGDLTAPWAQRQVGELWLVRARALGSDGLWVFGPRPALADLEGRLAGAGVQRLSPEAAEALRIESGEPRVGAEITGEHFPMEIGLGGAIDYSKGCFLGQEPIVRIRDRGHVNWRLALLRFDGDVVPAAGDAIESDVKPRAGRVTSAARRPGGAPVALGLVHVSVPVGAEVRVRHGEAALAARVHEAPLDTGARPSP